MQCAVGKAVSSTSTGSRMNCDHSDLAIHVLTITREFKCLIMTKSHTNLEKLKQSQTFRTPLCHSAHHDSLTVLPIRERASGAPVAAVATAVLPGREFHLPATSPGPRGLGGALHPGVRSRRCVPVSGRPADLEGHG